MQLKFLAQQFLSRHAWLVTLIHQQILDANCPMYQEILAVHCKNNCRAQHEGARSCYSSYICLGANLWNLREIEVREAAITRAIIAASRRPLLGPIASVYKKKEFNPDPNPD